MIKLNITLSSDDSTFREIVSYGLPPDEWQRLLRFHSEVERLRATEFVQNRRGGQIAFKWEAGAPVKSNASVVDTEEVGSMLLRLRPFVLNDEECYFHKIKKLLKRRLEHSVLRKHIDHLAERFTLEAMQWRVAFKSETRQVLSVDVVMDWLNSYEYHRDAEKKAAVESDLGFFGEDQAGLPVVLFALVDMVQAILDLDGLVETLVEIESGARSEITFPSAWVDET